jgi:hypothetical protein
MMTRQHSQQHGCRSQCHHARSPWLQLLQAAHVGHQSAAPVACAATCRWLFITLHKTFGSPRVKPVHCARCICEQSMPLLKCRELRADQDQALCVAFHNMYGL